MNKHKQAMSYIAKHSEQTEKTLAAVFFETREDRQECATLLEELGYNRRNIQTWTYEKEGQASLRLFPIDDLYSRQYPYYAHSVCSMQLCHVFFYCNTDTLDLSRVMFVRNRLRSRTGKVDNVVHIIPVATDDDTGEELWAYTLFAEHGE